MDKVAVILTDGENTFYDLPYTADKKGKVTSPGDTSTPSDYTAYGRLNAPRRSGSPRPASRPGRPRSTSG